jgi:hypothetical protein
VHVSVVVGAKDDVAPPSMSRDYSETLKRRVNNVTLTIVPELGHEILLEPVAYETLKRLVESARRNERRYRQADLPFAACRRSSRSVAMRGRTTAVATHVGAWSSESPQPLVS